MMRSTVEAAVVVWSVPNTRCPVSAVSIAIAMVSRSRISPTNTMSGSSRSAARRVHPEAGQPGDLVGEVGIPRLLPFLTVAVRHDGEQHELELLDRDRRRALAFHLAVGAE